MTTMMRVRLKADGRIVEILADGGERALPSQFDGAVALAAPNTFAGSATGRVGRRTPPMPAACGRAPSSRRRSLPPASACRSRRCATGSRASAAARAGAGAAQGHRQGARRRLCGSAEHRDRGQIEDTAEAGPPYNGVDLAAAVCSVLSSVICHPHQGARNECHRRQRRENSRHRPWHHDAQGRGLRRRRKDRVAVGLPPHRHRRALRQRSRGRRGAAPGAARVRPQARGRVRNHEGLSRQAGARRFRALVRRKPRQAQAPLGRSAIDPLAEPESAVGRHAAGPVQGQAGTAAPSMSGWRISPRPCSRRRPGWRPSRW